MLEHQDKIHAFFSAYCGGLWLAALRCLAEAASVIGEEEERKRFCDILERAKEAYNNRLWNGINIFSLLLHQWNFVIAIYILVVEAAKVPSSCFTTTKDGVPYNIFNTRGTVNTNFKLFI